jgi:hypothetical protein
LILSRFIGGLPAREAEAVKELLDRATAGDESSR